MSASLPQSRPVARIVTRGIAWQPTLSVEALALCAALFFSLFVNATFWRETIATGDLHGAAGWLSGLSLFVLVTALHTLLLLAVLARRPPGRCSPLLLLVSAVAAYYMNRYTIYFDADMVRNVLHTDARESSELLTPALLPSLLLYGVLPSMALWRVRLKRRPWPRALAVRGACLLAAAAIAAASALALVPGPVGADAQPPRTAPPDHARQLPGLAGGGADRPRPQACDADAGRPRRPRRHTSCRRETARAGAGGRRNAARAELGPQRLRAPDHAAARAHRPGQLPRRHRLRHQHRGVVAMHVLALRPRPLRQGADRGQRVAAARARPRRHRGPVARQPVRLQGRVRRAAVRRLPARQGRARLQWRELSRRGHARWSRGRDRAPARRHRGGAAPARQPRSRLPPALSAAAAPLHADLRQRRPRRLQQRADRQQPTTMRCCTPTNSSHARSACSPRRPSTTPR